MFRRGAGIGGQLKAFPVRSHGGDQTGKTVEVDTFQICHWVSGEDIDGVSEANLKVQQGSTQMLKRQVRVLLPLK